MMDKKVKTINEYIQNYPSDIQNRLNNIYEIVKKSSPDSIEVISYNMPAFKLKGKILLYFAAHKEHIGLYPYPATIKEFKSELVGFETSKGGIRFPNDKPLPVNLIKKIIKFREKEILKNLEI